MISTIQSGVVKVIRSSGQAIDSIGKRFELNPYIERLQPSTQVVKLGKNVPKIDGAFIAPSATVVGRVTIAKGSSVWYGAVIRGDVSTITIGEGSSIGDRTMIHCASYPQDTPTVVGRGCVVGTGAILHGCTLEDSCQVGEGAQVMDGARVGKNAIVGPGSLLGMGKVVPAGQLWAGVPARYVRDVTVAEAERIVAVALENALLAGEHAQENAKSWQTIEQEEYDFEQSAERSSAYYRRLTPEQLSKRLGEVEHHQVPGRILNSAVSSRSNVESRP